MVRENNHGHYHEKRRKEKKIVKEKRIVKKKKRSHLESEEKRIEIKCYGKNIIFRKISNV